MGVEVAAVNAGQDEAWKQVRNDAGADTPPPTGDDLGHSDDEKARIRNMVRGNAAMADADPKVAFRAPGTQQRQQPDYSGPAAEPDADSPAPAHAPRKRDEPTQVEDDTDQELERRILGGATSGGERLFNDSLETKVKIGDREVPLSRLKEAEDALIAKHDWEARLAQRERQVDEINSTMVEAAREFKRDPFGALDKIGIPRDQLIARAKAEGLISDVAPSLNGKTPELPEDADDATKALFHENRGLRAQLSQFQSQLEEVRNGIRSRDMREVESARRQERLTVLGDVGGHLRSLALKMPSMRAAPGKLTPTAELLLKDTIRSLADEMPANVAIDKARSRAEAVFAQTARTIGMTPKEERARAALGSKRPPVPIRPGSNPPMAVPGANGNGRKFNFEDDDQRHAAAEAWWKNVAAQE